MRKGKFTESGATLRMKMDMTSPNPNMWDQVAYRIKYTPHPHAGDTWCIYPTYDYTHCIIDSLEHIDYSICTLEFESRRESYYWVLEALELYRPKVYEMSRLNISYTVLSKRKLLKLVNGKVVRGWDDPRMPTIKGLRRRGYTAKILNAFCNEIGVTRNENTVQYERLAATARNVLHETSPRVMAVLDPILVVLSGVPDDASEPITVPDFPFDPSRGSHTVDLGSRVYIDQSDFREVDSEDYFGLAPNKAVTLKYAHKIHCDTVEKDDSGRVVRLLCSVLPSDAPAPKGTIQWVPFANAVPAEVRMYDHLFTVEEPDDQWESQMNPLSEVVKPRALLDPSVWKWAPAVEQHFQFERLGFFVVDKDSSLLPPPPPPPDAESPHSSIAGAGPSLVFNLTVALKDSKPKVAGAPTRSRKEEQAKQLAEKQARMCMPPEEMFRSQTDLYSAFDADGVPTHDAQGQELSKNGVKKLKKEWEKQKRLYESAVSAATKK